jgi:hypothetical protein
MNFYSAILHNIEKTIEYLLYMVIHDKLEDFGFKSHPNPLKIELLRNPRSFRGK